MTGRRITILGSTGTIGRNTLKVVAMNAGAYEVFALTANRNAEGLAAQCAEFQPRYAVIGDTTKAPELRERVRAAGVATEVRSGAEALCEVASHPDCDVVMAAIVGGAGLPSALAAAESGKRILLANKEAIVMSGALFMEAVEKSGACLMPIDSEHNAIFQCLPEGRVDEGVRRVVLTASGGPFRTLPLHRFKQITPEMACAHPNWQMGRKISVDSATMMNKGLELIEASWLFGLSCQQIDVMIHPESIIHSMVEYKDGSYIAQLGAPDMRTPIAHGLAWPERIESGVAGLDFAALSGLTFETMEEARYPCFKLATEALALEQSGPVLLNSANEVAVAAFLSELIAFTDIPHVIETVLERAEIREVHSLLDVYDVDAEARALAKACVGHLRRR